MVWWDFTNPEFIVFFIVIALALLFLIALITSFAISRNRNNHRLKDIVHTKNTIIIYIIDFRNNSVLSFNRSSIQNKTNLSLSQFYLRFAEEDVDRLKSWLYSICVENTSTDDYLEIDIVSKKKVSYYSILRKIKYSQKDGILHLESHMMRYISPSTNNKNQPYGYVTKERMKEIIENQKNLFGYTYCIRFFYKRLENAFQNRIEKVLSASLKDVVYGFASKSNKNRYIIDEQTNEIILFDIALDNPDKALQLSANIVHNLKKTIGIKGYSESINFSIGIVENAQYYQDFGAIVKTSQQACIYAEHNSLSSYFYTRSNTVVLNETGQYSQEITRLINGNVLRYNFRAIVQATTGNIIGYFNYNIAPESPFSNYMEMAKYSAKVHRNKEFFAYVSKNVVNKFISEINNPGIRLFMPVSLSDVEFMNNILLQIRDIQKCPLTLVFYERDFDEDVIDFKLVSSYLMDIKRMHISLCLEMHDQSLLLSPEVYSHFDYFVVGSSMVKEIKKSKFMRLSIHTLVEQLLKYKKPIIASDVEGWQSIELLINSGIDYLSSETISPTNPMLIPLEKKRMEKLIAISNKI